MNLPFKIGDHGPEIVAWQAWFNRMYASYAPPVDGYYGNDEIAAVKELQRRLGLPQSGIFDEGTAAKAEFRADGLYVPPSPIRPATGERHLGLVYRGTGGVIGEDYVSKICQGAADLVEEINPEWPATMGGIPVGTAPIGPGPSMAHAVDIGFEAGKKEFLARRAVNPAVKVVIIGYSAGAVVAAKLRQWIQTNYPDNYLCSVSLGDPTRPEGGAFYGGLACPGQGIASWHYGDTGDWRHCWLAAPGDMYTSAIGRAWQIMSTGYEIVTNVELTDPLTTAQKIGEKIPAIMDQFFSDPLAGFDAIGQVGQFVMQNPPTAPHIQYEFREALPGMTYLQLGVQHVRDWCSRTEPIAA